MLGEGDIWEVKKSGKVVAYAMKHSTVERVAHLLEVEVVSEEWPVKHGTLDNRMKTFCRFTVRMPIITQNGDRIGWSDPSTEIGIGTSDDNAGSEYMARKRAYDRAVLNLIGLFDVYSDIEAEALQKDAEEDDARLKVEDLPAADRKPLGEFIKELSEATTVEDLNDKTATWKERLAEVKATDQAKIVLRNMVQIRRQQLQEKF